MSVKCRKRISASTRKSLRGTGEQSAALSAPGCGALNWRAICKASSFFFRNRASLPARLVELAILVTVRFWGAQYAWNAHEPRAVQVGLGPEVISAISAGRRPVFTHRDEAVVFDFCTQLQEGRAVGDTTYEAALDVLGEQGVVELTAVAGFYATVSMTVKVFDIPAAEG